MTGQTLTPAERARSRHLAQRDAATLDSLARWFQENTDPVTEAWGSASDFIERAAIALVDTGRSIDPPDPIDSPDTPEPFTAWLTVAVPVLRHPDGTWSTDGPPLMMEQYGHQPNTVTDENGLRLSDAERAAGQEAAALRAAKTAGPEPVPEVCDVCAGTGTLVAQSYGYATPPRGWVPVQACDTCRTHADDEHAARALARHLNTEATYYEADPDENDDPANPSPGDWAVRLPIEHAGIEAEPWTPGRAGR